MTAADAPVTTEDDVESPAGDTTSAAPAVAPPQQAHATPQPAVPDEGLRQWEESRALIIGFLTGLSIAFIFLVYIVFEVAKLLP